MRKRINEIDKILFEYRTKSDMEYTSEDKKILNNLFLELSDMSIQAYEYETVRDIHTLIHLIQVICNQTGIKNTEEVKLTTYNRKEYGMYDTIPYFKELSNFQVVLKYIRHNILPILALVCSTILVAMSNSYELAKVIYFGVVAIVSSSYVFDIVYISSTRLRSFLRNKLNYENPIFIPYVDDFGETIVQLHKVSDKKQHYRNLYHLNAMLNLVEFELGTTADFGNNMYIELITIQSKLDAYKVKSAEYKTAVAKIEYLRKVFLERGVYA